MDAPELPSDLPTYSVECIDSVAALEPLRDEWNGLLRKSASNTVYLTHDWLTAWWHSHPDGPAQLHVLLVRREGRLVGIAPFARTTRRMFGLPYRTIEFISTAEYADHPSACAATLDLIVEGDPTPVIHSIVRHLTGSSIRWHLVRLHPILSESRSLDALRAAFERKGLRHRQRVVLEHAVVHVFETWEEYTAGLSKRFRRHARVSTRDLGKFGAVFSEEIRDVTDPEALYEMLLDVERRSWKWDKGIPLNSVSFGGFFRRLIEFASRNGWLRLRRLRVGNRWIAYYLALEYEGAAELLKKSYDKEFEFYYPGGILEWEICEGFFHRGVRTINFMWGDMAHKQKWCPELDPRVELTAFSSGALPLLLFLLTGIPGLWTLRRWIWGVVKRLLRKLHMHPRFSELTRDDQCKPAPDTLHAD